MRRKGVYFEAGEGVHGGFLGEVSMAFFMLLNVKNLMGSVLCVYGSGSGSAEWFVEVLVLVELPCIKLDHLQEI